ncbi:MAG TPA: flagellar hook capping FlgD N-terminal domain-containing protein [Phenylobacterium sp.]|jgi:flagellar basal-body rod modification protein FlgD|uniref:flagellar hook assembly protein FlgD n=1 Tax=Phenylobacterium sp. TaxID=1871053 RepID=UPI002D416265|nr:flagellar hook capping FlgD N-terminal domain-containing protein [Phenylobacterium sp.]HZZ67071.1 flagellar hook capping FlgD N-terminal domain-containing protein [Phenylobacterium sp.]
MTVTAPSATTPAAQTTTPATGTTSDATLQGLGSLADNFNTFLTLLTTQLQNQDPTAPLDSNQFTQQLVQMTGVEQQLNTNSLLQQVVNNTSGGVSSAVSMIGSNVKATSTTANLTNGQAQWVYNLPSAAADLKVEVLDSNGNIVAAQAPTDLSAGDKTFTWNGKNLAGTQLPNGGTYTLQVTALDASGNTITTPSFVEGTVTGVTQSNGAALITVNGSSVPLSSVVSVTQANNTNTNSNTSTGS